MALSDLAQWSEEKEETTISVEEQELLAQLKEVGKELSEAENAYNDPEFGAGGCCACMATTLYQEIESLTSRWNHLNKQLEALRKKQGTKE